MFHRVVGQTVAAIDRVVGVEHGTVAALQHPEAIITETLRRIEIEDEQQSSTCEGKYLIGVIVPNFLNGGEVECRQTADRFQHVMVEIAQEMIT